MLIEKSNSSQNVLVRGYTKRHGNIIRAAKRLDEKQLPREDNQIRLK